MEMPLAGNNLKKAKLVLKTTTCGGPRKFFICENEDGLRVGNLIDEVMERAWKDPNVEVWSAMCVARLFPKDKDKRS